MLIDMTITRKLLLESGDYLLLESGDKILLELNINDWVKEEKPTPITWTKEEKPAPITWTKEEKIVEF